VPRVAYDKLSADRVGEASDAIRARVQCARDKQRARFSGENGEQATHLPAALNVICNADMRVGEIRQYCRLDEASQSLMRSAMAQMQLSARAYHRVLKLARTIADLAGDEEIQSVHLAEALQYRPRIMG
jgi:magnesium chelatase family protein